MKMTLMNIKSSFLKRCIFTALGGIFFLSSVQANAESIQANYKVYWGGMHVADLQAKTDEKRISTQIDTKGLVGMVSNYKNQAEAELNYHNGEYVPTRFSKKSQKTSGNKHTEIAYKAGRVDDLKSSENLSQETAKEAGNLRAVDPLSAFVIARAKVREALRQQRKSFSLSTYDGKKLSRLHFELLGTEKKDIAGVEEDVLHIRMTRVPLSGFGSDEASDSVVELYVDDEHLIPLIANANAPIGHATIVIDKRCFSADECA